LPVYNGRRNPESYRTSAVSDGGSRHKALGSPGEALCPTSGCDHSAYQSRFTDGARCLSQTGIVSKRLGGSSWFFAKITVAYDPLKLSEILDLKFRHGTSIVATSTRCQLSTTKMDVQNWKSSVELN